VTPPEIDTGAKRGPCIVKLRSERDKFPDDAGAEAVGGEVVREFLGPEELEDIVEK